MDPLGPSLGHLRQRWRIKEEQREEEEEKDRRDAEQPVIFPSFPVAPRSGGGRRTGGGSGVSMGSATVATVSHRGPRNGVPTVVNRIPPRRPVRTNGGPGGPQVSDTVDLSVKNPQSPPVTTSVGTAGGTTKIVSTKTGESMDLGSIITELGTAYIGARYGGRDGSPFTGPVMGGQQFIDVPFVDVVPEAPTTSTGESVKGMVYSPTANCGQGNWVKRRRRRRKRLITPTDLNDIAALKAIIGGGQALNAAVIKACN